MKNIVIKPIGKVLKQAGLVSDSHLATALKIQSEDNQVRFGTILVQQGIIKQKTVDFFAEQLPKLLQQPQTQPLGYFFQKAALITSPQIDTLLEEQKQTGMLLGELALNKQWIKAKTLNFFLKNFSKIQKKEKFKLKYLSPSQQEIIQPFHLETKAAAPYSLIKEIFTWTGAHPFLTKQICKIIADYSYYYFIPAETEASWVKILIENAVIDDWRNQALGEYLKTVENYLLNSTKCLPINLLETYLKILQQEKIEIIFNREKAELINLGLVVEHNNKIQVSNRIYQAIFNLEWVQQQLLTLDKIKHTKLNSNLNSEAIFPKNTRNNQFIPTISSKISTLCGLLLISILFTIILLNNSQRQIAQENDSLTLAENNSLGLKEKNKFEAKLLSGSTFCLNSIPTEIDLQEAWLLRLEQEKEKLKEQFPDNCQNKLNQLLAQLNPSNYEFYLNYQQALNFLEKSDEAKALEQLYQAAEKAIIIDKERLLLKEIIKNKLTSLKQIAQNEPKWQFLTEVLIKADPNDYQLLYQRAKLKLTTDHNHHHDREFALLFAAARKAIKNQQTETMLSQLKQDQKDRFKNLSIGHSQWVNLIQALEQKNQQLLD